MNRKIILLPLTIAAAFAMASCANSGGDSSVNSALDTSAMPNPSTSEGGKESSDNTPSTSEETEKSSSDSSEILQASIALDKTAVTIKAGGSELVKATVANIDNKKVIWTSEDENVATVKAGLITGVAAGTTKVIATLEADSNIKAEVNVTVEAVELKKLSSVTGPIDAKETYYGVVTAKTTNGFMIDDGTGALFVQKVLPSEFVIGDYVSVTDKIVAYWGLLETSQSPEIKKMEGAAPTLRTATPLTKEIIDTVQAQCTDGKTSGGTTGFHLADMGPYTFTAKAVADGSYTNFYLGDDTTGYKLSPMKYSGNKFIADVNYTITGYYGGFHSKGYYQFIIKDVQGEYAAVESISVTPETSTIKVNGGVQLNATALPANANQAVTWTSDHEDIATVNEKGYVTGVAAGTAIITATSVADNTKVASATITVEAASSTAVEKTLTWSGVDGGVTPTTYTDGSDTAVWEMDGITATMTKNTSSSNLSSACWANKFALRVYKGMKLALNVPGSIESLSFVLDYYNGQYGSDAFVNGTFETGFVANKVDDKNSTVTVPSNTSSFSYVSSSAQVRIKSIVVSYSPAAGE